MLSDVLFVASGSLLALLLFTLFLFIVLSARHHLKHKFSQSIYNKFKPFVSIIVPCYNEGKVLGNCIESLIGQTYPDYEIIIVNDGSSDDSLEIANDYMQVSGPKISVLSKENGGKASALNAGIAKSDGEIIVCIDADSIFLEDTTQQLVKSFKDQEVAGVGGNVKVANRKGFLNRQQSLEYITGLTLQRKAFALLGCMQVISGAIGAFRKSALIEVGGYSGDSVAEDMDITVALASEGYKIVYNPSAVAYTEAPETLKDFMKQRFRWIYGSFQVLSKYKYSLWEPKYKSLGIIGLPYFLVAPWIQVTVSFVFFLSIANAIISQNVDELIVIALMLASIQVAAVTYAIIADKEQKKLIIFSLIDSFIYYHLINYATIKAGYKYAKKHSPTWDKLERKGKNIPPSGKAVAQN